MEKKPPQQQTNEEWLHDYNFGSEGFNNQCRVPVHENSFRRNEVISSTGHKVKQGGSSRLNAENKLIGRFLYSEHRTTRQGRLVLEFVHVESQEIVAMFFNVQVESQRTGKKYKTGRGCGFTCKRKFKLRKWWEKIFGKQPYRWSRAHHELSKLRRMNLEGKAVLKTKQNKEETYWELIELDLCERT